MQEEVTQKTIALSVKTGKLTAQALRKKYSVDFTFLKDNTTHCSHYIVLFKAKDTRFCKRH